MGFDVFFAESDSFSILPNKLKLQMEAMDNYPTRSLFRCHEYPIRSNQIIRRQETVSGKVLYGFDLFQGTAFHAHLL